MKEEEIKVGLWLWRKTSGYFKKINNPCLVSFVLPNEIKLKMFNKLGEAETLTFTKNEEINVLLTQVRICDISEVKKYFNDQLIKLNKEEDIVKSKITKLKEVILSI